MSDPAKARQGEEPRYLYPEEATAEERAEMARVLECSRWTAKHIFAGSPVKVRIPEPIGDFGFAQRADADRQDVVTGKPAGVSRSRTTWLRSVAFDG